MDSDGVPRARPVTGLLVLVGLLAGLTAALVWHFATPQPAAWWPGLPLLAILGMFVGWFVGACANAEGWRILRVPAAPRRPLVALVCGTALVAGLCFAWAWTLAPPVPDGSAAESSPVPISTAAAEGDAVEFAGLGTPFCGEVGVMCVYADADVVELESVEVEADSVGLGVGSPWLTFPILSGVTASAAAAGALAGGVRVVRWGARAAE
ncbi:hypothetical protein LCL87_14120 [Rhodococcus hoagii]|nr:hypothetical protein [Prescottella equi]